MAAQNQDIKQKIKFARFLAGWNFQDDSKTRLITNGDPVLPTEYLPEMRGSIFCPECSCPLDRRPHDREADRRGRAAFFAHRKGYDTECGLRTLQAQGKRYETEEEAAQAIVNGSLVIVSQFLQEKPEAPQIGPGVYDRGAVEDLEGEPALVPIARHRGRTFQLPSKITTVRGICNNFDRNLHKYYVLPGGHNARALHEHLTDVRTLNNITDHAVLVYGKIVSCWDAGPNSHNCRFVKLSFPANTYKDFSVKMYKSSAEERGIGGNRIGRVLMVYGRVRENGIGLSIDFPAWGEVSLLADEYNRFLYE